MIKFLLLMTLLIAPLAVEAGTYAGRDSTSLRTPTITNIMCKQPEVNTIAVVEVTGPVGTQLKCADNFVPIGYKRTPLGYRTLSKPWLKDITQSGATLYTEHYLSQPGRTSPQYGSTPPVYTLLCAPINVTFQAGACTE